MKTTLRLGCHERVVFARVPDLSTDGELEAHVGELLPEHLHHLRANAVLKIKLFVLVAFLTAAIAADPATDAMGQWFMGHRGRSLPGIRACQVPDARTHGEMFSMPVRLSMNVPVLTGQSTWARYAMTKLTKDLSLSVPRYSWIELHGKKRVRKLAEAQVRRGTQRRGSHLV